MGETSPEATRPTIDFCAKPIAVISHPRSGTHLTIDGLRHFFIESYRWQRYSQAVHDLYINLDRLDPTHPFRATEEKLARVFERCEKRVIIKSHCFSEIDQVAPEHHAFAQAVLDEADVVYVVRDVRPVMTSYMALRPLKFPDSPLDVATFLRTDLDGYGPPAEAWAKHVRGWIRKPGGRIIRFEEMMKDYAASITKLGADLGLHTNGRTPRTFPKPKSIFENKARRVLGIQNCSALDNLRMQIKTPKWREVMTPDDLKLIRKQAGDVMEELGYTW